MNEELFLWINAAPGLSPAGAMLAVFVAKWLVWLAPLALLGAWFAGDEGKRRAVLQALYAIAIAMACVWLIRHFFPLPRPFMLGLGQQYLEHQPTPGFPSNHSTFLFTAAFACLACRELRAAGICLLPLALLVGWSRVFLGVHFPFDILGGLALALLAVLLTRATRRWSDRFLSTAALGFYGRILGRR